MIRPALVGGYWKLQPIFSWNGTSFGTTIASLIQKCSQHLQEIPTRSSTRATICTGEPGMPSASGTSVIQSTGQTSTQNEQPVHSSSMTCAFGTSLGLT